MLTKVLFGGDKVIYLSKKHNGLTSIVPFGQVNDLVPNENLREHISVELLIEEAQQRMDARHGRLELEMS